MNEGMLIVREEREADFDAIRQVVMEAFASAEHSDGDEHALVERLRQTDVFENKYRQYRGHSVGTIGCTALIPGPWHRERADNGRTSAGAGAWILLLGGAGFSGILFKVRLCPCFHIRYNLSV